jgi:hypothetical protein
MHCIPTWALGFIIALDFMLLFTNGIRLIGDKPLRVFDGSCQLWFGFASSIS